MQCSIRSVTVLTLLCFSSVQVAAEQGNTNPLGKVIQLLDSLAAKIQAEGEAEAKSYKAFVEWCDDASKNLQFEIKAGLSKKDKLQATITKAAGDVAASTGKIEELAASLTTDGANLKSATAIRKREATDFGAEEAELTDAIDTLGRAINTIQRAMMKNPAAFAQMNTTNSASLTKALGAVVEAASISTADQAKLVSLVQGHQETDSDDDALGAPAAAAYQTHSTSIVDVLEDLKEKAEEQLSTLRKAETNTRHNYEMLRQSLADQMTADTKDMDDEKTARAASDELKAASEGDLTETEKGLADDKKALGVANGNCMQTAADHDATIKARAEELSALAKAKEILSSTTGGAVDQTYSMLQTGSTSRSRAWTRADLADLEVVTLVKRLAREQHSATLAQLASRISAVVRFGAAGGEDPFAKVRAMIADLLARLESAATSDASEKGYCDEQMSKTEEKKNDLQSRVAKLSSKIDKASSASAMLKQSVRDAQEELAVLAKQQAEMDTIRRESHAAYVTAKADLQLGLDGVRKALGVLREYYGAGGASASMLQAGSSSETTMQQPSMPEQHSKATGAGQSITGILEVVESDFAKNLAVEETQESDAQSEHDDMTQSNAVTKTIREQDVAYETKEFKALDRSVSEVSTDRQTTNTELMAVLDYDAKIKERCIAKPETYESRKGRREAEISGLKEALSILENETAFTQRRKRGNLRQNLLGSM